MLFNSYEFIFAFLPVTIAGKPYVVFADESGLQSAACSQNKSPTGFPRIIDISDPTHPTVVSKLPLGVHDPANCTMCGNACTPLARPIRRRCALPGLARC